MLEKITVRPVRLDFVPPLALISCWSHAGVHTQTPSFHTRLASAASRVPVLPHAALTGLILLAADRAGLAGMKLGCCIEPGTVLRAGHL
mgnify:CR=1 FL=1